MALSETAVNKRKQAGEFVIAVVQKAVANLADGILLETEEQALDMKITENVRQFLHNLDTTGTRSLDVQLAKKAVIIAVLGVAGNEHQLTLQGSSKASQHQAEPGLPKIQT